MTADDRQLLQHAADRVEEGPFHHPRNEHCEMFATSLGDAAGLQRIGVHLVRIPPGREANIYHAHEVEEEFCFIVSGRGVVELDGDVSEVGPGDFIGLPTSVAHQLRNPFDDDLVYLVGGERREFELASFPKIGKHSVRVGRRAWMVDDDQMVPRKPR